MLSFLAINYKESLEEIFQFQSGMLMLKVNLVFVLEHKMLKQISQVYSRTREIFCALFFFIIINLCIFSLFIFMSLNVSY